MKEYEIIGLVGHQGVGKDFIGKLIIDRILPRKNTLILAFADHLKITAIGKFNADPAKVYGQKDYETRTMLQRLGTEEGRNVYGEDVWVNVLEAWMDVFHSRGVERFIITDVRFMNEARRIKEIGGKLLKIDAPDRFDEKLRSEAGGDAVKYEAIKNHQSETEIDAIENIDYIINNRKDATNLETQLRIALLEKTPPETIDNEVVGYWGFYG